MRKHLEEEPLRLLVISHLFAPDVCGGAAVFSDMCYGLARRNCEVTVRCAYPYYPEWKNKSGRNGLRIERELIDGVQVERHGMFIPSNPRSTWQRLLYEGSFFLSLCRSIFRRGRYDAVIVFCPLAGSVAYAAIHKLFHGKLLWLNVQDLPADAAAASHIVAGRWGQKLLQGVQRWLFNRADLWSSISPIMVERLEQIRDRDQPVMFVPNWLHESIAAQIRRYPTKVGRGLSRPVRLLYAGNIGSKQGLLRFCQELAKADVPFRFQIHGDGGAAADLRDWLEHAADARFSLCPVLDEPAYARALDETDLLVITEKPASGASFFPSKTVPALASATPILAVSDRDSPLGREMNAHQIGPWFSWDQCSQVAELIRSLPNREPEFRAWQSNAIDRSQSFVRERCLDFIEATLQKLVADRVDVEAAGVLDAKPATLPV
jgi:colanic acid biosynthesis glycosyl transferase WcaI